MESYHKRETHLFSVKGVRFLLEVRTLRVYEIDDLTESILSLPEPLTWTGVEKSLAGIYDRTELKKAFSALVEEGVLLNGDEDCIEYRNACASQGRDLPLTSLVLNISQECNMRCVYCYADHGLYNTPGKLMDIRTGEASVELLLRKSGRSKTCHLTFFGGEPLLNYQLLKHLVVYGKKLAADYGKKLRFGITTNGTLLNSEIISFFKENGFSVVISLDGPPSMHDAQRPLASGEGSYRVIAAHLDDLLSGEEINVGCRCTVTPYNLDLESIDAHFTELGFKFYHLEAASFGPFKWREDELLEKEMLQEFNRQYGALIEKVWERIKHQEYVEFRNVFAEMRKLDNHELRFFPCGMGTSMMTVSAEGDIYPCHRLVGLDEYRLGSVFTENIASNLKNYHPLNVMAKEGCGRCWARHVCAGDCPAESLLVYGREKAVERRCVVRKKRLEWAIWLYSRISKLPEKELREKILSQEFYFHGLYD
ncbi:MAG: uncharacterized protein PWR10_1414 [Halanaerobiales bacterium]|nr:uncharacterized protein [Halanaerobiales bacterium]